jgi:maltose/moltooligosaccharide transporter
MSSSTFKKPYLSFWQIWNMSFGFLGIQFGFAIQNANTSRIFSTLGAEESELPILWLAAPMTGLLVQPIIGYFSDRTWHPVLGRRRPYFAVGAILASLALCIMPNSSTLWMAAGMLWIMDASINISMEPFRAFVGDMLPASQRTTGFAMQSFFIGIGAVVGSNLPWLYSQFGFENRAAEGSIPPNIVASYYTGAIIFITAVLWTVFSTKEYPPDVIESDHKTPTQSRDNGGPMSSSKYLIRGIILSAVCVGLSLWFYYEGLEKELYVLCGIFGLFGISYIVASLLIQSGKSDIGFVHMVRDFQNMPKTMTQLAVVQFFTWFALFSMWIYTTPAVTSSIFNSSDPSSKAYAEGADWVTVLFSIYNGVAALAALAIPFLARNTSRRVTHLIALTLGGIGLISVYFIKDPDMLILSMIGVGIAWASILSMPYAMLSSSLPASKMGYYMGIFNFFIVIPQIVAASILGFLVARYFDGHSIYAFLIGGIAMIVSGFLTLMVDDKDETPASAGS